MRLRTCVFRKLWTQGQGKRVMRATAFTWRYQAVNLEAFRRFFGNPQSTFSFLRAAPDSLYPSAGPGTEIDAPCKQGEEYIVFLRWNDIEHLFQAHLVVPVREGQVRSPHIEEIRAGMKLEAFLTKLRSMQE